MAEVISHAPMLAREIRVIGGGTQGYIYRAEMQGPRHVMRGCGMASEWPMVAWGMRCHSVIRLGRG
jgi:hypothetical protein